MKVTPSDLERSPFLKAGFISKQFYWWLTPFIKKGNGKELEVEDLYAPLPHHTSKPLGNSFGSLWEKEKESVKILNEQDGGKRTPKLINPIVKQFGPSYMLLGILALIEECFSRVLQPVCLGYLIRYFGSEGEFSDRDGILFASGLVFGAAFYTITHHPFFFGVTIVGMKIRIACCSIIYRKALRLSQASLGETTIGQMINLLSNDVNRFDHSVIYLHYIWIGPIKTIIVTYFLWGHFGPSSLGAIAVIVLFLPLQGILGKLFAKRRVETAGVTDVRIRIMNEIINGMRVIKLYTWEKPFSALVAVARKNEIDVIKKTNALKSTNFAIFFTSSKFIFFVTLIVYIFTGNSITAEKVFVGLSLLNTLRRVMMLFFPYAISQYAESIVSVNRIQEFLLLDERLEQENVETEFDSSTKIYGVEIENLDAKWTKENPENTLTNINLNVQSGELLAIIGHVGSGKGSILQAILKELPINKGNIKIRGKLAYASQVPWIFSGSVRENILFGLPFESTRYEEVVEACALTKDFQLLPYGDRSLVGERGISLSGGQKARINLARAIYTNAEIMLLDDPLSAVDAEVGRHIYYKCITGILKSKAVILVTHQVHFLKAANNIMLLKDGKIEHKGTFEHIMQNAPEFLMQNKDPHETKDKGIFDDDLKNIDIEVNKRKKSLKDEDLNNEKIDQIEDPTKVEEKRNYGSVDFSTYFKYLAAGSNGIMIFHLILTNIIAQALYSGTDYWLNIWVTEEEDRLNRNETNWIPNYPIEDIRYGIYHDRDTQIIIYTGLVMTLFIVALFRTFTTFDLCMNSSISLHKKMFSGILRSPMKFFEENPSGRILNRFTKDMGQMDERLPETLCDTTEVNLNILGVIIIVSIVNPILLAPTAGIAVVFIFLRKFYLNSGRSIKRIEGLTRSPVFSHISTSLYGLSTIRSMRAERNFEDQFDELQDLHTASWHQYLCTTRWFAVYLDWLATAYVAVVTYSFLLTSGQAGPEIGLAISSVIVVSGQFQWGVRQSAELENQMVAVERIIEYTKLESEKPLDSNQENIPPKSWPSKGHIVMKNMELKYGNEKPVLHNITCEITPGEKIGVVGRTGAGKTSLLTALFRIVEPSGEILIDGVNVLNIGLHDLRSKISIIPQDPVLFTGTLRKNFDPFGEFTDNDIWSVLTEIHLAEEIKSLPGLLDTPVAEGGSNFSVGQRQLVCLGRAILRQNKILVLDEATANIDLKTDEFIQETIRIKFSQCTVITIAHRLNTVIDSDRILVLEAGEIKEFDTPKELLKNSDGFLTNLINQTGKENATLLKSIAQNK